MVLLVYNKAVAEPGSIRISELDIENMRTNSNTWRKFDRQRKKK